MIPDDTSVTTSEPADFNTVKSVEEKSTNVSVKKLENYSYTWLCIDNQFVYFKPCSWCTHGCMLDFVNCFVLIVSVAINSLQIHF